MPDRGDQVGQRLAGAGAGLDGQVVARLDRVLHGPHHRDLAGALDPAHRFDGGAQQILDGGNIRLRGDVFGWGDGVGRHDSQPYPFTPTIAAAPGASAVPEEFAVRTHGGIQEAEVHVTWQTGWITRLAEPRKVTEDLSFWCPWGGRWGWKGRFGRVSRGRVDE
ncbi:hypothetical protein GCM10017559_57260 [Streptosporangium longisporum]|uniref:Uncharacterized protein n=1 Tax=Streptosporangium longisporum TaxID=46187 RepID=A0ABP6KYY6_9ACTN